MPAFQDGSEFQPTASTTGSECPPPTSQNVAISTIRHIRPIPHVIESRMPQVNSRRAFPPIDRTGEFGGDECRFSLTDTGPDRRWTKCPCPLSLTLGNDLNSSTCKRICRWGDSFLLINGSVMAQPRSGQSIRPPASPHPTQSGISNRQSPVFHFKLKAKGWSLETQNNQAPPMNCLPPEAKCHSIPIQPRRRRSRPAAIKRPASALVGSGTAVKVHVRVLLLDQPKLPVVGAAIEVLPL